ncbi:hypothetical protein MPER_06106 [Moniliophthora perniciosa FA553]|nr:hypothetical protein MPER_06106 [Moniliophthora perniciosa FA553]
MAFEAPTPKVYALLPPPVSDIDDVLAILWTGPSKPTRQDWDRCPVLVRRNVVKKALEWLILNHPGYAGVQISEENLNGYNEDAPPCSVEYYRSVSNKTPESGSLDDNEPEDGTDGNCEFVVHGLTGEKLDTMTVKMMKAWAWQHLEDSGKVLAVGHKEHGESICVSELTR